MKKRVTALWLCVCMLLTCLVGCGGDASDFGKQLESPANGEEIAVMHTSMGDIYIRFFPEEAPKAVENFKTHAQNGYYDGLIFHRVINDFMIQGGDPTGTGTGGDSIWGYEFEDEFDASLGNLYGSLAMANAGENTNGSQFFINQNKTIGDSISSLRKAYEANKHLLSQDSFVEYFAWKNSLDASKLSEEILSVYEQHGGNIHLDGPLKTEGGHTVFGQVFKGMDVVDAIAAVATDGDDKPLEEVTILSVELTTYQG